MRAEHVAQLNPYSPPKHPAPEERKQRSKMTLYAFVVSLLLFGAGVLGTIVGLIKAFGAVGGESVDPSQKARILAEGISEAMRCTAYGVTAALVAVLGFGASLVLQQRKKQTKRGSR